MCPVPVLGISRPAAVRWANTWRKMICRHGPARAGWKERSTHDEKRILWQHMQKRLSPKKRKTQNNIKLWGERKEGRKEGNFSLSLFMEQICNRCTRLLAEGQKQRTGCCENGAAQGTCHHIPSKVSKHSNHFLRWFSTCLLGRALSSALMLCRTQTLPLLHVSSPVITVPQATAPPGSKMTLTWFHQVQTLSYWTTKLPISAASPFQTEPSVEGADRAQQSLEIFSIISMAKKEILTKSSNKKRKSCTSCSCSE